MKESTFVAQFPVSLDDFTRLIFFENGFQNYYQQQRGDGNCTLSEWLSSDSPPFFNDLLPTFSPVPNNWKKRLVTFESPLNLPGPLKKVIGATVTLGELDEWMSIDEAAGQQFILFQDIRTKGIPFSEHYQVRTAWTGSPSDSSSCDITIRCRTKFTGNTIGLKQLFEQVLYSESRKANNKWIVLATDYINSHVLHIGGANEDQDEFDAFFEDDFNGEEDLLPMSRPLSTQTSSATLKMTPTLPWRGNSSVSYDVLETSAVRDRLKKPSLWKRVCCCCCSTSRYQPPTDPPMMDDNELKVVDHSFR